MERYQISKTRLSQKLNLTEYALNPDHPYGGAKAKILKDVLGYDSSNYEDLIAKIFYGINHNPAELQRVDEYGGRYKVFIPIKGPSGRTATITTGWFVSGDMTRLATIFLSSDGSRRK